MVAMFSQSSASTKAKLLIDFMRFLKSAALEPWLLNSFSDVHRLRDGGRRGQK